MTGSKEPVPQYTVVTDFDAHGLWANDPTDHYFVATEEAAISLGRWGVPVNAVSKLLHVDPSFVTTQSKLLEKKGFVRRKTSSEDARIVNMSLSDKTYKHLASLASQQETLNEFIFQEFSAGEINDLTTKLASLKKRLEKACMKVAVDF